MDNPLEKFLKFPERYGESKVGNLYIQSDKAKAAMDTYNTGVKQLYKILGHSIRSEALL